jgi:hypothetical protein
VSDQLRVTPITLAEARLFVDAHHRHHPAPQVGLFAAAAAGDEVRAVVIVGRPVARALQDGYTAEVTRLCALPDTANACSMLYAAAWRACRALGYRKLITYTLATEPGSSLKAAGWRLVGEVKGRSWDTPGRPRVDKHPTLDKFRWEAA